MSTQAEEPMDVSFDALLNAETHATNPTPIPRLPPPANPTVSITNNTNINIDTCDVDTNDTNDTTEDIDYFGDYTNSTVDKDIKNGALYNPHTINNSYDLALTEYISNQKQPFYKSPYSNSYRKRNRRISDMTMEERDAWEQMAKRNKRRRLNTPNDTNSHPHAFNKNINDKIDDDYDESSSESSSASFEAILFENNMLNTQSDTHNITLSSSSDDDEPMQNAQSDKQVKQQIENLVRIPKKKVSAHNRSHLDLIKAARESYKKNNTLPILEDFTRAQNITKKRAKRAILQVMRENNLNVSDLRRRVTKKPSKNVGLQRVAMDESESEESDSHNSEDNKRLKLLNLPINAGKYPFDSAVEKAMLRLLNRLKKFNDLFIQRRTNEIKMDLSIMCDKVSSMQAYANIGIDFRFDFEKCVRSFKEYYQNKNKGIIHLCEKFLEFGKILIEKSDSKLVQRARDKPMAWHLKQMMKAKRNNKNKAKKQILTSEPVDIEGFWKIPYKKLKYKGDQSRLERLDRFTFENPFKYESIFEYIPCIEPQTEQRLTMARLESAKKSECKGMHCDEYSKLGPYDVSEMKFKTECICRQNCMECSDKCACAKVCKNRGIQNGERKVMNKHLREQLTFGIDQSTRRRIAKTVNKQCGFAESEINSFIENILQPSFNSYLTDCVTYSHLKSEKIIYKNTALNGKTAPFFMTDILRMILHKFNHSSKDSDFDFGISEDDAEMSKCLLGKITKLSAKRDLTNNGINKFQNGILDIGGGNSGDFCEEFYPIYPKGNGVVCMVQSGLHKNEFIIEYFGEVYPAWRWYEKCDLQKQVTRALSDVPELPDFFNIMLEKQGSEYDLLFIDPIKRGNFGSRFSHSCAPNTQTVPMIVNGKYLIAIYSQKSIKYGQELTFDYNSVTESEQEYRSAICLCSQFKCRGTYLAYAGSTNYLQILSLYHNTLHRQSIIFKACMDRKANNEKLDFMRCKLKERHISHSVTQDLPVWAIKYAYLISEFIEFESTELPKELRKKYANINFSETDIENEVYGVKQQRIQNIVITLDKIKYVLRNQSTIHKRNQCPIAQLSKEEIYSHLWNDRNSLVCNLIKCLKFHFANQCSENNKKYICEIESLYQNNAGLKPQKSENNLQKLLFEIRDKLRNCVDSETCYFSAASDLLHLWANTKHFFTDNKYESIKSMPFTLRELGFENDLSQNSKVNMNLKCQKPYGPLYIWGQMTFWWKQTVEKPDTSLSHVRRGCVYLPYLDCCFSKKVNKPIIKTYDNQTRNYFIQSLFENCHQSWSNSLHFTFKGNGVKSMQKVYASPFLDHYLDILNKESSSMGESHRLSAIVKELKQWQY